MNKPPSPNPSKARLQELRAIPERDRTDAEWDELHELEIQMAPGNRENGPLPRQARPGGPPMGQPHRGPPGPGGQPRPPGQERGPRPPKKFHKRHKPRTGGGSSSGGSGGSSSGGPSS